MNLIISSEIGLVSIVLNPVAHGMSKHVRRGGVLNGTTAKDDPLINKVEKQHSRSFLVENPRQGTEHLYHHLPCQSRSYSRSRRIKSLEGKMLQERRIQGPCEISHFRDQKSLEIA